MKITILIIEQASLKETLLAEHKRTMQVEAEVRQQVARELHDGPAQKMQNMVLLAELAQKILQAKKVEPPQELQMIREAGLEVTREMRVHLGELRPLALEEDGQGLALALQNFLEKRQPTVKMTKLRLKIETGELGRPLSRQDRDGIEFQQG